MVWNTNLNSFRFRNYFILLTLIKMDDKELSDNEKIEIYSGLSRAILMRLTNFVDDIKFGIQDERDFQCSFCGKVDRRLLQQNLSPFELLPFDSTTKGEHKKSTGLDIYFGV